MTFKEILEVLLLDCDEDIDDLETVNKFKSYINRGYKELAKRENFEKVAEKIPLDNFITLPDDFLRIVEIRDEFGLIPYSTQGNRIYVETYSINPVKLIYTATPDPLVKDTNELETNQGNIEFIINYAKWLYYLNDGLLEEASSFKSEYENMPIIGNNVKLNTFIDVYGGYL